MLNIYNDKLSEILKLRGERIRPTLKSSLKGAQYIKSKRRIVNKNLYKYI
jgi:hypothetical protein